MPAETTSVVFLGAGASKSLGLPLTNEIFGEVLNGISDGTLFEGGIPEALENRQALKGLFDALLPGAAGAAPFITDLLSMLDHAMLQANALALEPQQLGPQRIAYQSSKDLVKLRTLLERGIYEVLKRQYPNHSFPPTTSRPADDGDEVIDSEAAEALYSAKAAKRLDEGVQKELVNWIQRELNASSKLSIVTTNYDLIPESVQQQLTLAGGPISIKDVDFGFPWRDPGTGELHYRPAHPRLAIYKLHGSLNWLHCGLCEHTYINPEGDIAYLGFDPRPSTYSTCHCTYWPLRHVMVAPSMVRDIRDPNILQIWMSALEAMRLAGKWHMIGYSMPPEDLAIRSLLIRAFHARGYRDDMAQRKAPEVTVVQLCESAITPFRLIFGQVNAELGGLGAFLKRQNAGAPTTP
jgi:hypothetical protein